MDRPALDVAEAPAEAARARELFAIPQFRWLTASNLAFFLAMGSQGVVRPYLAYHFTKDTFLLGVVTFAVALPMLLLSPFGGVAADRIDRRKLILGAQAVALTGELVTFALLVTDRLRFWHLVGTAAVMGCVFPFLMPARQSVVANLVGRRLLGRAIAVTTTGINVTRVVGPALPGLLIQQLGVKWAYLIGVLLYIVAFTCGLRLQPALPLAQAERVSVLARVLEGVRYVRADRAVLVLLVFGLVPMFLALPFQTLLVVFAEEVWHQGPRGLSQLSVSMGLGGIAGSMVVARWTNTSQRARRMLLSMLTFGVLLIAFSYSPWYLAALPLIFLANAFASWFGTLNNTAIQLLIPDAMRGRVSSFLMMSFSLPMVGSLVIGAAAKSLGAPLSVSVFAALAMAASVAFYYGSDALRGLDARMEKDGIRG
ncbi:MAG TPA: MFS transporter [Myxococcota bacterium]|nr:MFS transporter [Myxococcota bacterium]